MPATLAEPSQTAAFEAHVVTFRPADDRRGHVAICSCGWSFRSESKIECELRASTHDLDTEAA